MLGQNRRSSMMISRVTNPRSVELIWLRVKQVFFKARIGVTGNVILARLCCRILYLNSLDMFII